MRLRRRENSLGVLRLYLLPLSSIGVDRLGSGVYPLIFRSCKMVEGTLDCRNQALGKMWLAAVPVDLRRHRSPSKLKKPFRWSKKVFMYFSPIARIATLIRTKSSAFTSLVQSRRQRAQSVHGPLPDEVYRDELAPVREPMG